MKYLFFIVLVCSGFLNGQVFETGLGSSALLELRRGGYDSNEDGNPDFSNHRITGKKTIDTTNGVYTSLYSLRDNQSMPFPAEVKTGDINGDGFDEIVFVSYPPVSEPGGINLTLSVYKGDDGDILFTKNLSGILSSSLPPSSLDISDLTGDGIKEIAIITLKYGGNNNSEVLPNLTILNQHGETVFERTVNTNIHNLSDFCLLNLDYNGDQFDDLLLITGCKMNLQSTSVKITFNLYDGNTGQLSDITPAYFTETEVAEYVPVTGNFGYEPRDLLSVLFKRDNQFFVSTYDFYTGAELTYPLEQFSGLSFNTLPTVIQSATLTSSIVQDIIVSFRCGGDANNDGIPDEFNLVCFNPFTGIKKFEMTNIHPGEYYYSQFLVTEDFNNDNIDEILHIFHSGSDVTNDGIGDGSTIQIISNDGSELYISSFTSFGLSGITEQDGVYSFATGDFGDGKKEIALLLNSGIDNNGNGYGDGYTIARFDPIMHTAKFHSQNLQSQHNLKPVQIISIKNDIPDKFFLRQIDLSDPLLATTRNYFLARNYSYAMNSLYHYYMKQRHHPIAFQSDEYYYFNQRDEFIDRIKKFSTAVTMEIPGYQSYANIYDEASSGALRLGRISSSFSERCYSKKNIDQTTLIHSLKSILSHLRWLDRDENYTPENNHALLFEIKEYFLSLGHLKEFKQFKIDNPDSFQKTMQTKITDQLHHIFDDGIHDEHSITYSFLIANACDQMSNFVLTNDFFQYSESFVYSLLDKVEKQFNYFLYAVKPLELNTNDGVMQIRPDIPVYGDSESKIVGKWFGKLSRGVSNSLLYQPVQAGYTDNWKNVQLIQNLLFAANSNILQSGKPPEKVSKFFPQGGYFVSRSNWSKYYNKNMYDIFARYMHFKAGEIVPRGEPYDGYTTNSRHGHADLLSVDLVGYNKNIVVDPGGYVGTGMSDVINSFIPTYFEFLYGYPPPDNNFDRVRSYFKSTAAHNTVNINKGQVNYKSNWRWYDLNSVYSHATDYFTGKNLDYIKAGYSKIDSRGEYSHVRTVLYNKPGSEEGVFGDYWIFIDQLDFTNYSGTATAEQIWHISPEQVQQTLASSGMFTGDNFIMAPLKFENQYKVLPTVIPGYTMTYWELNYSRIIKYKALLNDKKFVFITIILPYDENAKITNLSLSPRTLYNINGESIDPFDGTGLKIEFTLPDGDLIEDYVTISDVNETFVWEPDFINNYMSSSNKIDYFRLINGDLYLTDSISADSISTNSGEIAPVEFELYQNYPNPFNIETTIKVKVLVDENYKIEIFDLLGRKVTTLIDNYLSPGEHNIQWNGNDGGGKTVASGVYFYTIKSSNGIKSKKMVLLK